MIIYKCTNQINKKSYIGQTTKSLQERKDWHFQDQKYGLSEYSLLAQAMYKYGWENFTWEILTEVSSQDELNNAEVFYIAKEKTLFPNGYNKSKGGKNWPRRLLRSTVIHFS